MTESDRPPSGWSLPTYPHAPQEGPGITEVTDAILTRVRRGDLRTIVEPTRWLRGAVHDSDGRLVVESQKIGGLHGAQVAQADPHKVGRPAGARRLTGTWLYGGHWVQHFGHFFTESVTTLWPQAPVVPEPAGLQGIVFHSFMSRFRGITDWQRELVGLAGYGDLPVEVIEGEDLRVDRLLVPGRSVVVNGWAHDEAVAVWRRMVRALGGPEVHDAAGPRVFFSRTAFNAARRAADRPTRTHAARDERLDRAFARAGFDIVTPESHSVPDQILLAARASVLAGCAGSALHLSAFAPSGVRVVELGDARSPAVKVPTQRVIDRIREHPSAFVPYDVPVASVGALLADLGL